jgi:hypothetical protein
MIFIVLPRLVSAFDLIPDFCNFTEASLLKFEYECLMDWKPFNNCKRKYVFLVYNVPYFKFWRLKIFKTRKMKNKNISTMIIWDIIANKHITNKNKWLGMIRTAVCQQLKVEQVWIQYFAAHSNMWVHCILNICLVLLCQVLNMPSKYAKFRN